MRFAQVIAGAAIVATVASAPAEQNEFTQFLDQHPILKMEDQYLAERPTVQDSTIFPRAAWGITDWSVGLLIGLYGPIRSRWMNNACESFWFNFGTNLMGYSKYFDKPFALANPMTWIVLALNLAVTAINLYKLSAYCGGQYAAFANGATWYENFNFLADESPADAFAEFTNLSSDDTPATPKMVGNKSLTATILAGVTISLESLLVYMNGNSEYYYFFWAKLMGTIAGNIFVSADQWAMSNIIVPEAPYIKYANQKTDDDSDDDTD